MTTFSQPQHASRSKRLLFSCWHFYLDPSNGASITAWEILLALAKHGGNTHYVYNSDGTYFSKGFAIDLAHAGDNYIVAAHPNGGVLNNYRFYTKEDAIATGYNSNNLPLNKVATSLMNPNLNVTTTSLGNPPVGYAFLTTDPYQKYHQTSVLTVWRTLWVELDQMYIPRVDGQGNSLPYQSGDQLADSFPAGLFDLSGHIATQLARACIVPQIYVSNAQVNVPGKETITDYDDLMSVHSIINHSPYRSISSGTRYESFWTLQVVSAFESWGILGVNRGNITFLFNTNIETRYNTEGLTVGLNKIFSIVLLHEIGHALWLEDIEPKAGTPPNTTYGIMVDNVPLGTNLINDNDKFTVENIRDIQKMGVPIFGPGSNRPR